MNKANVNASGEQENQAEKKTKRHRRGTRGGQKARAARGAGARSAAAAVPEETPEVPASSAKPKTTRGRKPRATKAKAAAAQSESPVQSAPAPVEAAPAVETPRETPVVSAPQEPAVSAPAETQASPAQPASEAPAQNTGGQVRPLGGYRAPMSRGGSNRMSFGGRGGGRHHFRPSGFSRPAVPPASAETGNAAPQLPTENAPQGDIQQPSQELNASAPQTDLPQQDVPQNITPQENAPRGAHEEHEGPEPGNELYPPSGRQPNNGGRQQAGFRGPSRVDRGQGGGNPGANQGRFAKFPQQQRGGQRNQGGQGGFNQQGNNRNNQQRQNWNQQANRGNQPRGFNQQHGNNAGQQRGAFNGGRQNNGNNGNNGGQPRFDRGPRIPHQPGSYQPFQQAAQPSPLAPQQPMDPNTMQPLPPQQNFQQPPVPQPRAQVENTGMSSEIESETRPLGAPAVPSPVVNEGAAQNPGASEQNESANGMDHANGVDNSALAPFAEDIEIEETVPVQEKRRELTGRDMIINVVEGEEVRIAIVRKGVLEEFYMERASNESHVGNIYKGRVTNVEPSIQAAFIDFGLGKNGFLHISDLHPMYFGPQYRQKFQRVMEKREAERKRQQQARAATAAAVQAAAEAAARGEVPAESAATPPGAPESHLSPDATSAPVLEANEAATLSATSHETDIDAELNSEAPPEVLFDSDENSTSAEESAPAAEQHAMRHSDRGADQPATPSAQSEDGTGEQVAPQVSATDAAASFPETQDPAAESAESPETVADSSDAPAAEATAESGPAATDASTEEDDEDLGEFELDDGGIAPMERVGKKTPRRDRPPIQQCLRRGMEVIVQVTKEGIGTKGPTLTTYVSIPGRALVMMPGMSALGVSRKIEDEGQRRNLRRILSDLNPPRNLGFIIRTAGAELSKGDLQGDLNYLVRMWKVIAQRIRNNKAPIELYQESDLVIRTMRDGFTNDIDRIIVDNEQVASRIRDFLSIVDPRSAGAVELYTGTLPIFQRYNIERQIENIHSRRVELPNGGSLVIDSAEALVAIDVNSGRYREQRDAEMTAFNMNKEAVKEIVRQLRLRDLGGVIVMDFIDMREERHKREIEHMLREHMKHDRAKAKVLRMSQFCMIEMTRQRVRPSIKRSIYMDCPHCRGTALIKTPESVSLDVMRRLAAGATRADVHRLDVRLYPTVANYLQNRKRKSLVELEEKTGKRINISADPMVPGDAVQIDAFNGRDDRINLQL